MDPVTILAITNASLGIARSLVHTIKELYELAEAYETAALGIRTVATQCNSFRVGIERINRWLVKQDENSRHDLDEDFWEALKSNIDTGALVVDDLNRRIAGLTKTPSKFRTRTKYLWNQVIISELQTQIQVLMSAISLLIQVIDIPTTGNKRSMSRAQSKRLNGLTKAARVRVSEQQQIQRQKEAEILITEDEVETSLSSVDSPYSTQTGLTNNVDQNVLVDSAISDETPQPLVDPTPPPYSPTPSGSTYISDLAKTRYSANNEELPDVGSKYMSFFSTSKTKATDDSNKSKKTSEEKVTSRSWYKMGKRTSKDVVPRSMSDPAEKSDSLSVPSSTAPATTATSFDTAAPIQSTPAAIESDETADNYFGLQSAMSGLSMDGGILPELEQTPSLKQTQSLNESISKSPPQQAIPAVELPSMQSSNPYAPANFNNFSNSEVDVGNSVPRVDYRARQTDSSTGNFDRIRPSQRVQNTSQRSVSQDPPNRNSIRSVSPAHPTQRQLSGGKLSSFDFAGASGDQQIWQTTSITNKTMKFKVKFEQDTFCNKLSAPAARALGVDDSIFDFDGIPMTHVTFLHTVSDGSAEADVAVNGDEVEFEVMSDHESRTPQLVLGAGLSHLARLMQEGSYIYWNPRSVPENLRTAEKLRLYRRFELTMW